MYLQPWVVLGTGPDYSGRVNHPSEGPTARYDAHGAMQTSHFACFYRILACDAVSLYAECPSRLPYRPEFSRLSFQSE